MKETLMIVLALGILSLSGCMEFVHGDHTGGYSDGDSYSGYSGRTGSGHHH